MPCPFATAAGVVASIGGSYTLLFQDRRYRLVAWTALVLLLAGWVAYFALWRTGPLRVGLEVMSVAVLVAGGLRVRWLVRRGWNPPLLAPVARVTSGVWKVAGSPWVLAAKVWLAAMLVMEWRGKASFSALEYGIVTAVLLACVAVRLVAIHRGRRSFAALESLASGAPAPSCPLGFGCARSPESAAASARTGGAHRASPEPTHPRHGDRATPAPEPHGDAGLVPANTR